MTTKLYNGKTLEELGKILFNEYAKENPDFDGEVSWNRLDFKARSVFCEMVEKIAEACTQQWISERDKARFWSSSDKTDYCWNWNGCKNVTGYGVFRLEKVMLAHRVAFQIINGGVDHEVQVLHKCDNPACINPDHLFTGTHLDNMKDKAAKGRSRNLGRSSKFLGVGWRSDSKKWRAYFKDTHGTFSLGCFDNEVDAAKAYNEEAIRRVGIKATLNIICPNSPLPPSPQPGGENE